jgi:hypothetical protein
MPIEGLLKLCGWGGFLLAIGLLSVHVATTRYGRSIAPSCRTMPPTFVAKRLLTQP